MNRGRGREGFWRRGSVGLRRDAIELEVADRLHILVASLEGVIRSKEAGFPGPHARTAEPTLEAQTAGRPETTGRMLSVVAGGGFEPPTSGL